MSLDDVQLKVKELNFKLDSNSLIPTIIQDYENNEVLMIAYMSMESLAISINEKRTCFWSRSRKCLWRKGETSGHRQTIKSIFFDCDKDALLIKVEQIGTACHNGTRTCFMEKIDN